MTWPLVFFSAGMVFLLGWSLARLRRRAAPVHPSLEIMRQKQFFEALVLYSPIAIVSLDFSHNALSCNPAFERLFGFSQREVLGHEIDDLITAPEMRAEAAQLTRQVLEGASLSLTTRRQRKDGSPIEVEIYGVPVILGRGQVVGVLGLYNDITERKRSEAYFKRLATHDSLTDLPNRTYFFEHLQAVQTQAVRENCTYSVLYLDLDGFKAINDSYGHDVGDRTLQAVATRLQEGLQPDEFVARLGGDEFAFVLARLPDEDAPAQAAQRILESLHPPFVLDGLSISVSASIGICIGPGEAPPPTTSTTDLFALLLKRADRAMYSAKELGKDQFRFYTETVGSADREGTQHAIV